MPEVKPLEVLPECQTSFSELRLTVGLLEHDILAQTKISDKLTEAVEKIQEMNANLLRMISLHELKHENTNEDLRDLEHQIELIRAEPKEEPEAVKNTKRTLDQLNKWKWMLIGGAAVLGWILAHLKWGVIVQLFGG